MVQKHSRLVTFVAFLLMSVPTLTFAAPGIVQIVPDSCNQPGGCQSVCDIAQLAQNVLNDGIYIAVFLSAVLFAWAGFQAVTAGGNAEKYGEAKGVFVNVTIGLIIILAGWLIVDTTMKTLVNSNGPFGPWNRVCNR